MIAVMMVPEHRVDVDDVVLGWSGLGSCNNKTYRLYDTA